MLISMNVVMESLASFQFRIRDRSDIVGFGPERKGRVIKKY